MPIKIPLLISAMMLSAAGPGILASPAHATDAAMVDASGGAQQNGRFLRLALAKSAVIKLPAEAKDVIVGDSAIVDVVLRQRNMAYLFARTAGQTNVFFFDSEGREILHLDLEVAVDTKGLKKLLDRSIPGNGITVDSTGPNIVLKGRVANAQQAKMANDLATSFSSSGEGQSAAVVNLLKVEESDQVMLKVRVVELKRTAIKKLGVNLEATLGIGTIENTPASITNLPGAGLLDSTLKLSSGGNSLDVQIKALEEQGLATTLAEPTLTAISGAPASFLAGGELPYETCNNDGDCNVTFKPYGVSLSFTPTVLSEGRIALSVATEVSDVGERTNGNPSIDTRRAQTSVEIPSGGSMMMAGLIKEITNQKLRGTPGLRTLPVLGALFSSRDFLNNQTELVVIVTPYIAGAVHQKDLATPIDNFSPPTDLQQVFLGRLNRVYGVQGARQPGVYHGKVGHIID